MDEKLKKVMIFLILLIIIFIARAYFEKGAKQNEGNLTILRSADPEHISIFRIYPRVGEPVGISSEFRFPDPIIDEFFQSLGDIHPYLPNHDTVDIQEHGWFLEVSVKKIEKIIPISFYIPSRPKNIVVGDMRGNDGYFQSEQLFHWYQKYKDRWLTPAAPPPGATATPTPP